MSGAGVGVGAGEGQRPGPGFGQAPGAVDVATETHGIAAVEDERTVVGHVASKAARRPASADFQAAGGNRGAARVAVGAREGQRTGAALGQTPAAVDVAIEAHGIRPVEDERAVVGHVAGEATRRPASADFQRAGGNRGRAAVGVGAGKRGGAGAGVVYHRAAGDVDGRATGSTIVGEIVGAVGVVEVEHGRAAAAIDGSGVQDTCRAAIADTQCAAATNLVRQRDRACSNIDHAAAADDERAGRRIAHGQIAVVAPTGACPGHGRRAAAAEGIAEDTVCVAHGTAIGNVERTAAKVAHLQCVAAGPGGIRSVHRHRAAATEVADVAVRIAHRAAVGDIERAVASIAHEQAGAVDPTRARPVHRHRAAVGGVVAEITINIAQRAAAGNAKCAAIDPGVVGGAGAGQCQGAGSKLDQCARGAADRACITCIARLIDRECRRADIHGPAAAGEGGHGESKIIQVQRAAIDGVGGVGYEGTSETSSQRAGIDRGAARIGVGAGEDGRAAALVIHRRAAGNVDGCATGGTGAGEIVAAVGMVEVERGPAGTAATVYRCGIEDARLGAIADIERAAASTRVRQRDRA